MPNRNPASSDSFRADGGTRASSRALAVGLGRQLTTIQLLDDLSDVTLTTPADGDVLTYNGTSSQWVNKALGGPHFVALTQAEYDALATKDQNTIYLISG
jgi:hypothetical protein